MKFRVLLVLLSSLLLIACMPILPRPSTHAQPGERSMHTGFSLIPVNENNWLVAAQRPEGIAVVKRGSAQDETIAIRAFSMAMPEFKSHDEFMGFAKAISGDSDPNRFKILSQDEKSMTIKGQPCDIIKRIEEDSSATKHTKRNDPMILEIYSLACKHPKKQLAVVVSYSHRYYSGDADPESEKKAVAIFNTLEFID